MALTAEQEAKAVEIETQLAAVEAGVKEIEQVVYDSLAIRNVGGGHVFNLALAVKPQIDGLKAKLAELRTV